MMKALVWIVWSLLSCMSLTQDLGRYTVEFQYTVQRGPNGTLHFQQTTLFDGKVIFYCNSTTLTDQPRQEYIAKTFSPDELKDRNDYCRRQYYEHMQWFKEIDHIINGTAEILQRRSGCKASGSSIIAFDEWAINGENFLTFEHEALKWTPASVLAVPVALKWNKEDFSNKARKQVYKYFGQKVCDKSRNKLHDTKTQTAGVEVRMVSKSIQGTSLLYVKCHVTGTGLSGVEIWLTKYGDPVTRAVNMIGPLPNGDETVQMNVQVQLEQKDAQGYQCHVKSDTIHACLKWGELPCDGSSVRPTPPSHDSRHIFYGLGWVISTVVLTASTIYFYRRSKHKQQAEDAVRARVKDKQARLLLTIAGTQQQFNELATVEDEFH